jgi:riboflavin synthase
MFTGLIEKTAVCLSLEKDGRSGTLKIENPFGGEVALGDSIAVNGACLTVEDLSAHQLVFHALAETFSRTNLGLLRHGSPVNLERALRLGDRLGGHLVSGHVDTIVKVLSCEKRDDDIRLVCQRPNAEHLLVSKGSVTLNGVSLTIAELTPDYFAVCLIPHTWQVTNLHLLRPGDYLNLETDMLGKYVRECLAPHVKGSSITMDTLHQAGFF